MTTLQKIKEIVERYDLSPGMKKSKIIDLCTQPADELRAWEDLTEGEKDSIRERFDTIHPASCYAFILLIATKPKEKAIWVCWKSGWKTIHTYDYSPVFNTGKWTIIKTTNSQIKEIGIMVEDWEKAVERDEV